MSALLASLLPTPEGKAKPFLRLMSPNVSTPKRLSRTPFLFVIALLLGGGMTGLLILNTSIQDQSVKLRELQNQARVLSYREAILQSEVDRLESSAELAKKASELGMRPNPNPAFIELPSGRVIGTPRKVVGNEAPAQVYYPPAPAAPILSPSAQPSVSTQAQSSTAPSSPTTTAQPASVGP